MTQNWQWYVSVLVDYNLHGNPFAKQLLSMRAHTFFLFAFQGLIYKK